MGQAFQQNNINYKGNILRIIGSCKEGNKHKISFKKWEFIGQLGTVKELENIMNDGAN